ncbi:MAG: type III-B CRISPR module RAMP protein Cmr1 [Planctomycetes bacterium]|nr:type III-B CRISPR module RAMP protein Cmr1 [Planctomycetota bacterium]
MTRKVVPCPSRPAVPSSPPGWKSETYEIHVVTPMFGGGVEPGEPDPVTLVRTTTIRGHLRFWWRATCGARFQSVGELRAAEVAIWGDTETPSQVIVGVDVLAAEETLRCAQYRWNPHARGGQGGHQLRWNDPFSGRDNCLPYVLFPFQGEPPEPRHDQDARPKREPAPFIASTRFRLTCCFPNALAKDVRISLWAWCNFGGIGARTRRGCGSIFCSEFAPPRGDTAAIGEWWSKACSHFASEIRNSPRDWPTLPPRLYVGSVQGTVAAWKKAISVLQRFRQGIGKGRNAGTQRNRPGRSRWPEPETVREVTGQRAARHRRLQHIPNNVVPRAAIGLPIVFHFKDRGDPEDATLYPLVAEERLSRMATPLIVKPLAVSAEQACPLILRLVAPRPEGAVLVQEDDDTVQEVRRFNLSAIYSDRLGKYPNSPMSGYDDAVEALIDYAGKSGFQEISR